MDYPTTVVFFRGFVLGVIASWVMLIGVTVLHCLANGGC
jgi:hypothetical protein